MPSTSRRPAVLALVAIVTATLTMRPASHTFHHPEATISEARSLVAGWIDHHLVRASAAGTPGCKFE
jgi:hypothetical protein